MASTKRKAPALDVPQSDAEADMLLKLYGEENRVIAELQRGLDEALAAVKANYEKLSKPHQEVLSDFFARLQAWGDANRARLTGLSRAKTVELPAGKIGWRTRPPSIKLTDKVEVILERLREFKLTRFIRTKHEINKDALLEEPKRAETIAGIRVVTDAEDFFIEPFGAKLSEPRQ